MSAGVFCLCGIFLFWKGMSSGKTVFPIHEITIFGEGDETAQILRTRQQLLGNILLDANVRLFPGDSVIWKNISIDADFALGNVQEKTITIQQGLPFYLLSENSVDPVLMYGSGSTVVEVLTAAGIFVSENMLITPGPDTPFSSGMLIEAVPLRKLQIASNGQVTEILSGGSTVGAALLNAGMSLQGADVSVPAADQPLPEDGRIMIVSVKEQLNLNGEIREPNVTWVGDPELALDNTSVLQKGSAGLSGNMKRVRYENGNVALEQETEEKMLSEPVDEVRAYGQKVEIRSLDTEEGTIEYYRSIPVYATSYSPCRSGTSSCISGTASGRKVEKGVVAVSSAMYKLVGGANVYIPGYGKAVIGDVGGGISGKTWVDLGYSDDDFVTWGSDTTMYFLTPVPSDIAWVLQ